MVRPLIADPKQGVNEVNDPMKVKSPKMVKVPQSIESLIDKVINERFD